MELKSSISEGLAKRLAPFEEVKEKILRRRIEDGKKRELLERLARMKAEAEMYYLEYQEELERIRRDKKEEEEKLRKFEERKRKRQAEYEEEDR